MPAAGPWAAWLLFGIGGFALGLLELRLVTAGTRLRDPILRCGVWLSKRLGLVGFLANAALIEGAPGAAVTIKVLHLRWRGTLILSAAILFASAWVPMYLLLLNKL